MKTKFDRFGIEIEGEFGLGFTDELLDMGTIKSDGSISSCSRSAAYHAKYNTSMTAREFVTEPIEYAHRRSAKKIFDLFDKAYQEGEFHWNASCGFHIHVSFKPLMPPEIFSTQFCDFFLKKTEATFPGVFKRRKNNRFCRAIFDDTYITQGSDRYRAINMRPAMQRHKTVEFRIWPASTPKRMYEFFKFTLKTIEEFLDSEISLKWDLDEYKQEAEERSSEESVKMHRSELNIEYQVNMQMVEVLTEDKINLQPTELDV